MADSTLETPKKTNRGRPKGFKSRPGPALVEPAEPETPFDATPAVDETTGQPPPETPTPNRDRPTPRDAPIPRSMSFFERIAKIAPKDWGTRAKIKVYRLAPVINRLVNAEHKFVCMYGNPGDPPLTEEQLKVDHGSGKYRLYLNYKAPSSDEKEIDRVDIDILDSSFPPKIPPGEWMDDPRNKTWAWAKPKDVPAPVAAGSTAASISDVAEVFRVASDLRREAKEEMASTQSAPPQTPAVPDISAQIASIFGVASQVVQMRTENPMVDILKEELGAMRTELAEQRKEREAALRAQLASLEKKLEAGTSQTSPTSGDWIENLNKLASAKETLAKLLGVPTEAGPAVRSRLSGTMEFFRDIIPQVINSPLLVGIGTRLMQGGPPMQAVPGRVAQSMPSKPGPAEFQKFVEYVTPSMISYLEESDGTAFAEWMAAGHTEWLPLIQGLTHNSMPGQSGAPVITAFYRSQPQWWNGIMKACGGNEATFTKFVTDFCAWKPETEAPEPEQKADEPESTETERIEV